MAKVAKTLYDFIQLEKENEYNSERNEAKPHGFKLKGGGERIKERLKPIHVTTEGMRLHRGLKYLPRGKFSEIFVLPWQSTQRHRFQSLPLMYKKATACGSCVLSMEVTKDWRHPLSVLKQTTGLTAPCM